MTNQNIIHIDTDETGVNIERTEEGGLAISVDSRETFISSLTADGESAHRIGDIATLMRINSDGTYIRADSNFLALTMLDAEWVKQNGVTREWLRNEQ